MSKDKIDLQKFKQDVKGRPFADLIQHHLEKDKQIKAGLFGTVQMLDIKVQPYIMDFIDKWNIRAYDKDFYQEDCATVFEDITRDAKSLLKEINCAADDETLFNIFQIIVLNYAYSAYDQPKMKEFMGVGGKRESIKNIGLQKKASAKLYGWIGVISFTFGLIFSNTQSNSLIVLGLILGNLGYFFGAVWLFKVIKYQVTK